MHWLVFERTWGGGCIQIQMPAAVYWDIEDQTTAALPNETGALLFGRWRYGPPGVDRLVITANAPCALTNQCPDGVRMAWTHKSRRHARLTHIAQGRKHEPQWKGTWHSHPTGGHEMSTQDTTALRQNWEIMLIMACALDGNWYPTPYIRLKHGIVEIPWRGLYDDEGNQVG